MTTKKEVEELTRQLGITAQQHSEAPASVNFKGITKGGFTCQWTLRDADELTLMNRQVAFMKILAEGGVVPTGVPATAVSVNTPPPQVAGSGGHAENWCSIHGVEMTKWDKEGRSWFSHKADDDTWCKGK